MAVSRGVDFSFARISAADIKGQGFSFACRYLASSIQKRISVAEVTDFKSEAIDLVLVWEDEANAALGGFNQGQHDAQEALNQAGGIGWPGNLPIYFAVDFDATPEQQAVIDDYLRGAASIIGLPRVGVYGGFYVVKRCLDNGTATFSWQTTAWSGGQVDPRTNIYQNGQSAFGGNADQDEALTANFGQWSIGGVVDDMVQPSEADVYSAFRQFAGKEPANPDQVKYYMDRDIRELYHDLMFYEILPKDPEIIQAFKDLQPWTPLNAPPYQDQSAYYAGHPKGFMYQDLAVGLKKKYLDPKTSTENPDGSTNVPVNVTPKPLPHLDPLPVPSNGQPVPPQKPIGGTPSNILDPVLNFFTSFWKAIFG